MNETHSCCARIVDARFLMGTENPLDLPALDVPEIAFIGRTNVGKSSLINRVTHRRSLARSSSTPGRTQEFNFFEADVKASNHRQKLVFVDLPGFGYSKFSIKKRIFLEKATYLYLSKRASLSVVCLLNDVRRDPGEEEKEVFELSVQRGIPLVLVVTKTDKLSSRELNSRKEELIAHYSIDKSQICFTGTHDDSNGLVHHILNRIAHEPGET